MLCVQGSGASYSLALGAAASLACSSWSLRHSERLCFMRIGTIRSEKRDSTALTRHTCDWKAPLPPLAGVVDCCWAPAGLLHFFSSDTVTLSHLRTATLQPHADCRHFRRCILSFVWWAGRSSSWWVASVGGRFWTFCDYDAIAFHSHHLSYCMLIIPSWYSFPFSFHHQCSGYIWHHRSLVTILWFVLSW